MSKLALFLAVPAAAGLVVWNLSLSSEIADLRSQLAAENERSVTAAVGAAPKSPAEPRVRETARANPQVTELVERLANLEARLPAVPAPGTEGAAAAAEPRAIVPASDIVASYSSEEFKGAVAKVLDDRDTARRQERMARAAEARTKFLLRDLTVTDAQRTEVQRLVLASMARVEAIRDNEAIPDEQRRLDVQAAQQEAVESLAAVLDAQSMETVRQRTANAANVFRRGGDGGGNAPGQGGGGGRRGNRGNGQQGQ